MSTRKIYVLRMRCEPCKLDKMVVFYRVPNASAKAMYDGHEEYAKVTWPEKHGCTHPITFTRESEKQYVWDLKKGKAVRV